MKNPMDDPAGSTVGEVFQFLDQRTEEAGAEAAIRFVMVNDAGKPERIAIFAVGNQAVRWAFVAEAIFAGTDRIESGAVDYSEPERKDN